MTTNVDEFIQEGTNVIIGLNKWSEYKTLRFNKIVKSFAQRRLEPVGVMDFTVIITSKSCKKYISDINSEKVIEVKEEPTFKSIDNSLKEIYPIYKKVTDSGLLSTFTLIALGGGSVIDTAKILSMMLSNDIKYSREAEQWHPRVSTKRPRRQIYLICVPSTAGTGAETTQFSTIWDKENGLKYSIVSDKLNRTIILDPEISLSLPSEITISTGIDALCQLLESTWSKKADKSSIKSAKLGYQILKDNIVKTIDDPKNQESRLSMLISSYLSGISISKANTTLCHSISYPLTALLGMPHGLACGFTLIEVIKFNSSNEDELIKNTLLATENSNSKELINEIEEILKLVNYKDLMSPFVNKIISSLDKILPLTITNSRASNNPKNANIDDIRFIVEKSIDRITN